MSARRTERLLNLVICLLHTRSYLSADRIRELVPGYDETPSDDAFKRAFERDKEDLRDLGIPLETGTNSAFDEEPGYRIARRDYALPDVTLEPAEAAAVGLAARMWTSAAMGAAATRAVRKLEAAGVEIAPLPEGVQPSLEPTSRAFDQLADAVHHGRVVKFDYRTGGAADATSRTVEPWGLVWWHGRWYVVGRDRDRDSVRVFRLSRVVGDVTASGRPGAARRPDGVDLAAIVASYDSSVATVTARVRLRAGRGLGLRRAATSVAPDGTGWDVVELQARDVDRLADQVLPYGADAVVVAPPEAVETVVRRLRALVDGAA